MNPNNIPQFLAQKKQQHLYRSTRLAESAQQPLMQIDGQSFLTFCSNDYLGLANHPAVVKAFVDAASHVGVGSGAAHLINGHSIYHQQLEEELATFTGRQRALLFSTGYMANLGVVNALVQRGDKIYADRLNHASLVDAALLARAKLSRYPHNDLVDLQQKLGKQQSGDKLILCDGVFSMDGDVAPVTQMAKLAKQHQAWFMVDDAHGLGVLGKRGAGLLEEQGLSQDDVPVLMGTLGKAVGTAGAFIAGSEDLIEYLKQTARTWIYTTAMPAAIAAATSASLKLIEKETWRREKLQALIQQFRSGAEQLGLQLMPSYTAIQPILLGDNATAVQASKTLQQQGILVTAIRPPTVPEGTARLRVTFSASHTEADVNRLLDALAKL